METIYFEDVDTLKVVLRDELAPVAETVDGPKEHIMMDFDEEGRLVGLTIEDAGQKTPLATSQKSVYFERAGENTVAGVSGRGH